MNAEPLSTANGEEQNDAYCLDHQIGYLLRLANQRHLEIFSEHLPWLTPTQFSVLIRLQEIGSISQNELGRRVGIDAATTNGVIDRLSKKGLVSSQHDALDKRRLCISLTEKGHAAITEAIPAAHRITRTTLHGLSKNETAKLSQLLSKLSQNQS